MGNKALKNKVITGRLLRSWVRCRRKAWLDSYCHSEKRIWSAHRTLQLDHQQRSFAALCKEIPEKGIESCKKGAPKVLGLRLKGATKSGQLLEGHPALLEKVAGKSCWGDFLYIPVIARQGKKLTREHTLYLAFTGLLLEQLQMTDVRQGIAVCKTQAGLEIDKIHITQKLKKQLFDGLKKLTQDLASKEAPPIASDRRKCSLCSWRGVCNSEAKAEGNLSEISGIGAKRSEILQEVGIKKIEELAFCDPYSLSKKLKEYGNQHEEIAYQLVNQAKAQFNGAKFRIKESSCLPELLYAPGVFIYDIESDSDNQHDFLHGIVKITRQENKAWDLANTKYQPILALPNEEESIAWEKIRRILNDHNQWPILHYGETELLAISRIAKRQGLKEKEIENLMSRFIDIHDRIKKYWVLPINSYGLKAVAKWTGFEWTNSRADGPQALLWWRQWIMAKKSSTVKNNKLKWILQYNKDDCLATWSVADWLLRNEPE